MTGTVRRSRQCLRRGTSSLASTSTHTAHSHDDHLAGEAHTQQDATSDSAATATPPIMPSDSRVREPSIWNGIIVRWDGITDAVRDLELYNRRKYRIVSNKGGKFRKVHACVGCAMAKHPCLIIFTRSKRSMEVGKCVRFDTHHVRACVLNRLSDERSNKRRRGKGFLRVALRRTKDVLPIDNPHDVTTTGVRKVASQALGVPIHPCQASSIK